jgi:hypothetical protein
LSQKRLKKITSESLEEKSVFDNIDVCPIWNWIKIQQTGDLSYLVNKGSFTIEELEEIFLSMQDEIFKDFGISEKYKNYLSLLKEKARITIEVIETDDAFSKLDLQVVEEDIKMILDDGKTQQFDEVVVYIEKFMGFQLNPKKVTIRKYYNYLKVMNENGKKDN